MNRKTMRAPAALETFAEIVSRRLVPSASCLRAAASIRDEYPDLRASARWIIVDNGLERRHSSGSLRLTARVRILSLALAIALLATAAAALASTGALTPR